MSAAQPRLLHALLMTPADMGRLGTLGVISSVQRSHACGAYLELSRRVSTDRNPTRMGDMENAQDHHPGSDSSQFKIMDPMMGYYATVTRLAVKETSPRKSKGWIPKQIRTRIQALRGMTNDSAYATISESDTESIELGKRPDFVVFSPDTMHRPAGKITETRPLTTAVDGRGMSGRKL
ncbi:unnamed protein product [Mycena citricolor]|uniref:Amidohydrolase 3 domain-containing protein n=1 Tax=Mycena citricolor TaxID=2018698 RepID=A0AAD2HCZ8_9AGAR|nr:unnamed protein product [Mycena citricolor]